MIEDTHLHKDLTTVSEREKVRMQSKYKRTSFKTINPERLTAIRNGNHEAYHEFYLDCVEPLFDFITLLLHSEADAEELCQQIFVNIWENRKTIDPASNFRGYIYKMAKSAAFKHMERRKVANKYVDYRLNDNLDFGDSPDELVMTDEMALIIQISLDNMPEQRRRVFEMSRYEGLSYDEIAKRLNITNATVRSHLSHAVKELRQLLALFCLFFFSQ